MNFEECLNCQCWFIDIIEDRRLEEEENFFVSIEKAVDGDSRVKLNSVTAQVIIMDRSNGTYVH